MDAGASHAVSDWASEVNEGETGKGYVGTECTAKGNVHGTGYEVSLVSGGQSGMKKSRIWYSIQYKKKKKMDVRMSVLWTTYTVVNAS